MYVYLAPTVNFILLLQVDSGFVIMGTQLTVMPANDTTIAKSLSVEDKGVDYTVAGEQCVMVLGNRLLYYIL